MKIVTQNVLGLESSALRDSKRPCAILSGSWWGVNVL